MSILTEEMVLLIYQAQILNVLDGDTIDMKVNLGMGFTFNARIRLQDVGCPEIFGVKKTSEEYAKGHVAKMEVMQWLYSSGPTYYLQCEHKGIHGRWLGQIWKAIGEESLNDFLISQGYGNDGWKWYSQEPLIEDWFDRNPVTAPGGQQLEAWHNWGRPVFLGPASVILGRFN